MKEGSQIPSFFNLKKGLPLYQREESEFTCFYY